MDTIEQQPSAANQVDPVVWARFLWGRFGQGDSHQFYRDWLALQCDLVANSHLGVLVMQMADGSFQPVASWPEEHEEPERMAELIEQVIEERSGLLTELESPAGARLKHYGVAYPVLSNNDELLGVVAVEVDAASEAEIQNVMVQLHWGTAWLELLYQRRRASNDAAALKRLQSAVDLLATVLSREHFDSASMTLATELATQLNCSRVSVGFIKRGRMQVKAVSHSADFGKRMNLIRSLGAAMDEAVDQRKVLLYPAAEENHTLILREHERLAEEYGSESVLTIPLYREGRYFGVLCLEKEKGVFSDEEINLARSVAALSGEALEEKRQNDRHILVKAKDSFWEQMRRLFGKRYTGRKVLAAGVLLLVVVFSFLTGQYRLSADAVLEGEIQRVITAPSEGYIRAAHFSAGDVIRKGQVLAELDDRDLRLERIKVLSERSKLSRQYQEALAAHDRARVNIIRAQLQQSEAQLKLLDGMLKRTKIRASFDGLVVKGDLSQRLGDAVQRGEELFVIAPLAAYRLILKVDESRIDDVQVGQKGELVLASLPDSVFPFEVIKLTPVSTPRDGVNYFRVEAKLLKISKRLRPGMEGIGKISIDERNLFGIWTRGLREWLSLWYWSWSP